MKRDVHKTVAEFRDAIAAEGIPVQKVYLYGSYARGRPHKWSDIDVAVVCIPFRKTRHEENMELRRIRRGIDIDIEPMTIHVDEMDGKDFFPLVGAVKREGQLIE